jgi:aldose 1-epimerase
LFPPNLIVDGKFTARGQKYQLPLNKGLLHMHGFFYNRPWQVDTITADSEKAAVTLSFTVREGGEIYQWYPHNFTIRQTFTLESRGLFQEIGIDNLGDTPLPLMLGFHTAFALDGRDKEPEAYRFRISLGDGLWGPEKHPLEKRLQEFRTGRTLSAGEPVFGQFLADPFQDEDGPCHGVLIENKITGSKLRYITDEAFSYWMIWNDGGNDSFICVEPQTCAVNAANMHEERDLFGFRMLEKNGSFTARNAFLIS